tara:strand:- start:1669 stop:1881 length:213 start_codon:yes stop_codon:yes gene_type:complete
MKRLNKLHTAKRLKMSPGHLCDILNGNKPVGKATAKKFGEECSRDWTDFLKMKPKAIESALLKSTKQGTA